MGHQQSGASDTEVSYIIHVVLTQMRATQRDVKIHIMLSDDHQLLTVYGIDYPVTPIWRSTIIPAGHVKYSKDTNRMLKNE